MSAVRCPSPQDPAHASTYPPARTKGEGHFRSAGAGSGALATGLTETVWLLWHVREQLSSSVKIHTRAYLEWSSSSRAQAKACSCGRLWCRDAGKPKESYPRRRCGDRCLWVHEQPTEPRRGERYRERRRSSLIAGCSAAENRMDNRSPPVLSQSMPRHQGVAIAYSIDCRTQRHIKVVVHVLRNCAAHQVLRRLSPGTEVLTHRIRGRSENLRRCWPSKYQRPLGAGHDENPG